MRGAVAALLRKDLRLELRSPEAVPAMVLFSLSTFVLFHFALDEAEVRLRDRFNVRKVYRAAEAPPGEGR